MKTLFLIAAFAAIPGTATAQVAKTSCLTGSEAEALITFALPSAVRAMTEKCTASLPATASLIQSGPAIAARYQLDADRAWPVARVAFDKMTGLSLTGALGEPGAKGLITGAFGAGLAEKVKPADCGKVDRVVNILEPLPAKNMAMLIAALMEFGGQGKDKSPISICPARTAGK